MATFKFPVEEIIEALEQLERGALVPTKAAEERLKQMVRELEFQVDFCHIPPGFSSTGLQRVADTMTALLPEFQRQRQVWEKEQEELQQRVSS